MVGGYLGGKSVSELDEKEWDLMMNMNLKSACLISKHVIPQMVALKYGKIMHVTSRTGLRSDGYDSAYAASKSGFSYTFVSSFFLFVILSYMFSGWSYQSGDAYNGNI